MSDADCTLDYLMREQIIAGDVDEVLRRLLGMLEEIGPVGTLVLMGYDLDDKESWFHSMELFSNAVMPAPNRALWNGHRGRLSPLREVPGRDPRSGRIQQHEHRDARSIQRRSRRGAPRHAVA